MSVSNDYFASIEQYQSSNGCDHTVMPQNQTKVLAMLCGYIYT